MLKELMMGLMGLVGRVRSKCLVLMAVSLTTVAALAPQAQAQTFSRSGLLISELRFAGPSGVHDGYVDLFNPAASTVQVGGLQLTYAAAPVGAITQTVTVPSGATIRPYGHYLVADSAYSLSSTASADDSVSLTLLPLGPVGVKLTNPDGSVIDAVGETGAPTGFYSGTPLTAPSPLTNGQTAFVRRGNGIALTNAGNNQADFDFVATDAHTATYGETAEQGAPDPMDKSSLDQIDPYVYTVDFGRDPTYDASTQTLTVYREIRNDSLLVPHTRLVFTHLTTYGSTGAGSGQAVLLAQSSPQGVYTASHIAYYPGDLTEGDPSHCGLEFEFCETPSSPSSLQPPSPAGQGGVNSALSMPDAEPTYGTTASGYGAAVYEYLAIQFHVPQSGKYSVGWNLYTSPVPTVAVSPAQGHPGTDFGADTPTPLTVSGGNWPVGDHVEVDIGGQPVCELVVDGLGNIASAPSDNCIVPPGLPAGGQTLTAQDLHNGFTNNMVAKGPTFKITPTLYLDPLDGSQKAPNVSAGNPLYEFGGGFAAKSLVSFTLDGHAITTSPSTLTTDSGGALGYDDATILVPAGTTAGQHTVTATDAAGNAASFKIQVYATTISLTPTTGHPPAPFSAQGANTAFTVSGHGWPVGDPVEVRIGGKLSCLLTADSSGTISATAAGDNCSLGEVPAGSEPVTAVDDENPGVYSSGTPITVQPALNAGAAQNPGNPSEASPGNQVYVSGAGYAASSALSFKLGSTAIALDQGSRSTDGSGSFGGDPTDFPFTFTVPAGESAGSHPVTGTDAAGNSATHAFTVFKPTVTITPSHGADGAPVTVTGSGWPAGDGVNVYIGVDSSGAVDDPQRVCGLTADINGNISSAGLPSGTCHVPGGAASGSQPVKAVDYYAYGVTAAGSFSVGS